MAGSNIGNDGNTGYTGCQAQTSAEVTNSANQMPGGTVVHEYFQSNNVQRTDVGWTSFTGAFFDDNTTRYGNSVVSTTEDDVWDNACSS